jgi:hypothetical protein
MALPKSLKINYLQILPLSSAFYKLLSQVRTADLKKSGKECASLYLSIRLPIYS